MPPKYNLATPVIFRVMDGEIIALLPTIPVGPHPHTCQSYFFDTKTGRHGYRHALLDLGSRARLATRKEYMPLKKELQRQGYRLHVVTRIAATHNQQRKEALSQ